jgi:hypothetical protein
MILGHGLAAVAFYLMTKPTNGELIDGYPYTKKWANMMLGMRKSLSIPPILMTYSTLSSDHFHGQLCYRHRKSCVARLRAFSPGTPWSRIVPHDRLLLEHEHHRVSNIFVDALWNHCSWYLRFLRRHVPRMFYTKLLHCNISFSSPSLSSRFAIRSCLAFLSRKYRQFSPMILASARRLAFTLCTGRW